MRAKKLKRKTKIRRGIFDEVRETPTEQELSFAERVGGKRTPSSGAYKSHGIFDRGSGYRGDVESKDFVYELKQTMHNSISLKLEWLNRLVIGAKPKGKRAALQLQFESPDRGLLCSKRWVLVEESTFLEMLQSEAQKKSE